MTALYRYADIAPADPITSDDVDRWYRTPGASGYTLAQRIEMLARRYRNIDPEGADGIRSRLNEVVADAMLKFDPGKVKGDRTKRQAFEAFLSVAWKNSLQNLQRDNYAPQRDPGLFYHSEINDGQHEAAEQSDPTNQFGFVTQQLAASLPPELQAGFAVLTHGLERGDQIQELMPDIEAASGLGRTTFFKRLRQNPTFQEWAAVAL